MVLGVVGIGVVVAVDFRIVARVGLWRCNRVNCEGGKWSIGGGNVRSFSAGCSRPTSGSAACKTGSQSQYGSSGSSQRDSLVSPCT